MCEKLGSSTLILVVGNLKLAPSDSKNKCTRTDNVFPPLLEVSTGIVAIYNFLAHLVKGHGKMSGDMLIVW